MADAARAGAARADGGTGRPDGQASAGGARPAPRETRDGGQPAGPAAESAESDEDGTGPIAAAGFGAWRATVAHARNRDAGRDLPGRDLPGHDVPGRGDAGATGTGATGIVSVGPAVSPAPLGYTPPGHQPYGRASTGGPPAPAPAGPRPAPLGVAPELGTAPEPGTSPPGAAPPGQGLPPRPAPGAGETTSASRPAPRPLGAAPAPLVRVAPSAPSPVRDAEDSPAGRAPTVSSPGLEALDLLDTLAEVVFRTDAGGAWTYLNPAWTRLTGFGVAESLGSRFIDYVHPEELEHTIALFMAVVVGGADHCHHETRYRTADGTYRRVQIRAKVLRDETGDVVGNVGTIIDVTESRFGAEMAGEQGALLELVPTGGKLDDLPVGVVIYDPDMTVSRASRVVDRLVGTRTEVGDGLEALAAQLRPAVTGGPTLGGDWGLARTAQRTRQAQIGDLDVLPGGIPGVAGAAAAAATAAVAGATGSARARP
ncbi:PAS domain-containing protein, partial [Frankia nepalensis]|uniref:PAS domain-containing protein n=1 Tax=Frankia nepalensis TaxID=1836974 RepID=UPI001EE48589